MKREEMSHLLSESQAPLSAEINAISSRGFCSKRNLHHSSTMAPGNLSLIVVSVTCI